MIIGSASIVQALTRHYLIDEFRFFLFPVALGIGKPLFNAQSAPGTLKLLCTKEFSTGVIRADYARA
jgi:dihydrofolate reductase